LIYDPGNYNSVVQTQPIIYPFSRGGSGSLVIRRRWYITQNARLGKRADSSSCIL